MSSTQLSCDVPPGAGRELSVEANFIGDIKSNNNILFNYSGIFYFISFKNTILLIDFHLAPHVQGISPAVGPTVGGILQISGSNFGTIVEEISVTIGTDNEYRNCEILSSSDTSVSFFFIFH